MAKKNNTAEKAILDAQNITKALKESTHNSISSIISEAIDKMVEDDDEPKEDNEDSYEVEDVDTEDTSSTDEAPETDGEEGSEEDSKGDDDEWSDMEDYKVGDNDYDFTGVDGDEILKVYNKLGDDDQIFVKKEDDGTYELKDEETGAEYVIELDADGLDDEESNEDFGDDSDEDEIEIEMDDDSEEPEDDDDTEYELEVGGDDDEDDDDMLNEEDLGYTDSYQKDVMPGLKMNEPADSKTTYSMDAGAPDGNSRPYSGYENKKSNLFTKSVNEGEGTMDPANTATLEEMDMPNVQMPTNLEEDGSGLNTKHSTKHSSNHINKGAYNQRHSHENGTYTDLKVNESIKKIISKTKEIQNENKQYLNALNVIKSQLKEAAVLNVTLAQVVKLLSEETTSKNEKKSIIERFNNVKTIAEGKALYNTIKRELNENKSTAKVLEEQISANPTNILNETTIYNKANNPSLNLMERMNNLYK